MSWPRLVLVILVWLAVPAWAQHAYRIVLPRLPVAAESPDKGVLVTVVKRWAELTDRPVVITVVPFKRALYQVAKGQVDLQFPFIRNPDLDAGKLPFDYSSSVLFYVNFYLYHRPGEKPDLRYPGRYTLTTDAAHVALFPFPVRAEYDIASALRRVEAGLADAFIFADIEVEPVREAEQFRRIQASHYRFFPVHALLPKGQSGGELDRWLTRANRLFHQAGDYERLMAPVYGDWPLRYARCRWQAPCHSQ